VAYVYRKAAVSDVDRLVQLRVAMQIELGTAGDPPGLDDALRGYFAPALQNQTFGAFVACWNDEVVASSGMVILQFPPSGRNHTGRSAYIMNMYTAPEHRGRGLASELLRLLIAEARQMEVTMVALHAHPKGRSIYAKAGFAPSDNEMRLRL
jgi:GNAT superfamily N-acetyltransferase